MLGFHPLTSTPLGDDGAESQVHSLVPSDITTGQPTVGSPSVSQVHSLIPSDITTGQPIVGPSYLDGSLRRVVSVTGDSRNTVELSDLFNSASISSSVNSATVVKTNNKAA